MIQTTLCEVLHGKIRASNHHVYLVRDADVVLYIGQSQDVIRRIKFHASSANGRYATTPLGTLIKHNREIADTWAVELYTVEECESLIRQMRTQRFEDESRRFRETAIEISQKLGIEVAFDFNFCSHIDDALTVDDAEQALILYHSPCLNVEYNPEPSPLPEKYQRKINLDNNAVDYIRL